MTDKPELAYPLDMYIKALEAMINEQYSDPAIRVHEDPRKYAERVIGWRIYDDVTKRTRKNVIKMLCGTPMSLYTVYPDHFPDPEAPVEAPDAP